MVGSNGGTPYGTVTNSGTLTLTGTQTNYGTLTNNATGIININTKMTGTGQVTNDGTIRLTGGAVDYAEADIVHHAFLVGYSPSQPNSPSQVLAASYDAAQVPLPAPPAGQAWYSTNTCTGKVVDKGTDLPAVFGPQTASPDTDGGTSGTLQPNVTLYAKAQAAVTFDATGGSPTPSTQTVVSGCTAIKPAAPTRTGYTFDGWSSTKDGSPYDFSTQVTKDLTLYARWTADAGSSTTPPPSGSGTTTVPVRPVSDDQAGLPQTGVDVSTLLYWALPMLLAGGLALTVVGLRRRHRRTN
ncbi:hypothetical protein GTY80_14070 [Amycolatopsis sp. SID8362]|nr:hypothetical protein [Amycolatopsis sp. SID8362]NED41069.1 InlB B-repeat-containing protein [Amycolatopsis sp. SID8362]